MQTDTLLHTKNIILHATPNCLILRKTNSRKRQLILIDVLGLGIIGFCLFDFIHANRTRFTVPRDFIGWLIAIVFPGALFYSLFDLVRITVKECKDYKLDLKGSMVMVNGKAFGDCSTVKLKIFKQIGYKAIGVSYKIRLITKRKRKTLSRGNQLNDAEAVASKISSFLNIELQKMWQE